MEEERDSFDASSQRSITVIVRKGGVLEPDDPRTAAWVNLIVSAGQSVLRLSSTGSSALSGSTKGFTPVTDQNSRAGPLG